MSTIQQDMTDTAVQMEHVAKRLANVLGSGSDEAWDQATQIHAAATIIRAWVDKHKAKVRAAVDEDAPKTGHKFEHVFDCEGYGKVLAAAVDEDAPKELPMLHTFEEPRPCAFYYNDVCNLGMTTGECGLSLATQKHCWGYQS